MNGELLCLFRLRNPLAGGVGMPVSRTCVRVVMVSRTVTENMTSARRRPAVRALKNLLHSGLGQPEDGSVVGLVDDIPTGAA